MGTSLTQQQQEAVLHDGHLLIVAGPGSGKTSTSVAKATRVLRDPARSLVMVTFTREAAEEMRKRLTASLSAAGQRFPAEDRLIVATFHSIAIRHLTRHQEKFRVLSPGEQNLSRRRVGPLIAFDANSGSALRPCCSASNRNSQRRGSCCSANSPV